MPSELVELARFPTSVEASIVGNRLEAAGIRSVLDGEAMASWFWHCSTATGGVRVLVSSDDRDRAREVLASVAEIEEADQADFDEATDWAADDQDDSEESELPEDLIRAWRASVIGFCLLPPFLNLYSMWLLLRHKFFVGHSKNWRVVAACLANGMTFFYVIFIATILLTWQADQGPEYYIIDEEGVPVEPLFFKGDPIEIPIVPY